MHARDLQDHQVSTRGSVDGLSTSGKLCKFHLGVINPSSRTRRPRCTSSRDTSAAEGKRRTVVCSSRRSDAEPSPGSVVAVDELLSRVNLGFEGSQENLLPDLLQPLIRRRKNRTTLLLTCLLRKILHWAQQLVPSPPSPYLLDNYAPIAECPPTQLEVEGTLPRALNGAYIRNGPNPVLPAIGKCNWVDGDGMLHACRIKDGRAIYSSHQIRTAKLQAEMEQGNAFYLKIGDIHGLAGLMHIFMYAALILTEMVDLKRGTGTANTSLVFHNGRLQALQEADSPYEIELGQDGSMTTAGRIEIDGRLRQPFTAHPKLDPKTGEIFYFEYDLLKKPLVSVGCLDQQGTLLREYSVDMITSANLMHDFALTENHIILYESPMRLDVKNMVHHSAGPFRWQPDEPTRLWVLDRKANTSDGIRCFTIDTAMNFMHTAAAFEVGSTILLYATVQTEFDMASADGTHLWGFQSCLPHQPQLYEFQLDLAEDAQETGVATLATATAVVPAAHHEGDSLLTTTVRLDNAAPAHAAAGASQAVNEMSGSRKCTRFSLLAPEYSSDMPITSKACHGVRTRFIYAATLGSNKGITFNSLLKYDLHAPAGHKVVGRIDLGGPEWVGGEPAFVPASSARNQGKFAEDAGYLVLYVHNTVKCETWLAVYDARTFHQEPVARAKIPVRIPYGFHGIHLTEQQLALQKGWRSQRL